MSLDEHIETLCNPKAPRLWLLKPTDESKKRIRDVYVSSEVRMFLEGARGISRDLLPVAGGALSIFDLFTNGDRITFGMDPHDKDKRCLFARNAEIKFGVCDARVMDPKPQVRIFGVFAATDVFIALTWNRRRLLGFPGAVARAKGQWGLLFRGFSPVVSEKVTDYVSQPVDPV